MKSNLVGCKKKLYFYKVQKIILKLSLIGIFISIITSYILKIESNKLFFIFYIMLFLSNIFCKKFFISKNQLILMNKLNVFDKK